MGMIQQNNRVVGSSQLSGDSLSHKYGSYVYAVGAGVFGFAATAIGSHFFKLSHEWWYIGLGVLLFLLSNHLLYKLKFNSYYGNGSTVTTVLVFTSQVLCMGLYKRQQIGYKWIIGVALILLGTLLIQPTPHHTTHKQNKQDRYNKQNKQDIKDKIQ